MAGRLARHFFLFNRKSERIKFMKKVLILAVSVLLFSGAASAQKTPTFTQYRVKVERNKSVKVNLASHKRARMFRTNLREAAKQPVNFAGHYILTTWGCGTNCSMSGFIDARNGRVHFPPQLEGYAYSLQDWEGTDEPLEYKPNSKLLILRGYTAGEANKDNPSGGIHYFEWNGSTLRRVKFIKKSDN